jgi:hypothetical protein
VIVARVQAVVFDIERVAIGKGAAWEQLAGRRTGEPRGSAEHQVRLPGGQGLKAHPAARGVAREGEFVAAALRLGEWRQARRSGFQFGRCRRQR